MPVPVSSGITCPCDVLNVHMSLVSCYYKSFNTSNVLNMLFGLYCVSFLVFSFVCVLFYLESMLCMAAHLTHRCSTIPVSSLQGANLEKCFSFDTDIDKILFHVSNSIYIHHIY